MSSVTAFAELISKRSALEQSVALLEDNPVVSAALNAEIEKINEQISALKRDAEPQPCHRGSWTPKLSTPKLSPPATRIPWQPKAKPAERSTDGTTGPGEVETQAASSAPADGTTAPGNAAVSLSSSDDDTGDGDAQDTPFVGASGASQQKPDTFKCADCKNPYYWSSWVANLTDKNEFAKVERDYEKIKAMREARGSTFENRFTGESVRSVCAWCAEKFFPDKQWVDHQTWETTSAWNNKAKESKGFSRGKSKVHRVLNINDQKALRKAAIGDAKPVSAKELFTEMRRNPDLRKASDWIVELCAFAYFWYACKVCGTFPVRSNMWWRLIRLVVEYTEGLESSSSDDGHWHCGCCCAQWNWATGGACRVFGIGNMVDESQPVMWAFVGDTAGTKLETKINALKCCTALRELDGKEVTRANLITAIESLNSRAEKKLAHVLGVKRTRWIESKDPSGVHNHKVFVGDESLMLKYPGTKYLAVDLNMVKEQTQDIIHTFDPHELDELLDMCAACLDLSQAKPQGPAQKKALSDIQWYSPTFKRARLAIKDAME